MELTKFTQLPLLFNWPSVETVPATETIPLRDIFIASCVLDISLVDAYSLLTELRGIFAGATS